MASENALETHNETATRSQTKTFDNGTALGDMTFNELLEKRRSIRNYQDRPVPVEVVQAMIEESTLAPSAGNEQPWKFVVVNDKRMLRRLSDESKKNILARISADPDDYARRYQRMLSRESFNVFYNAPCLVIILGPSNAKNLYVDCALAASYFMMAASARGLGTCWVNFGTEIYDPEMRDDLGIPGSCTIVAPITLGYPASIPPAPRRKEPKILKIVG